jgi:phosphoribosyl-dephospho-CoA transferase
MTRMPPARHDLADLSRIDRGDLAAQVVEGLLPPFRDGTTVSRVRATLAVQPLPGIVARPSAPLRAGQIHLGVAFPFRCEGARVKSAIAVPLGKIAGFSDPFVVARGAAALGGAIGAALRDLAQIAERLGLRLGVIGSAAMEIATGLPYTTADSDLDLVVAGGNAAALEDFSAALPDRDVRVDAEVLLRSGGGVKLAEFVSGSNSLVLKEISDVRLIAREEVVAAL